MITISRIARKINRASFFHVIVQGINKENIFLEERNKNQYFKLLNKLCEKNNIKIIAYCIMDNHAHFLLHVNEIKDLSKAMHSINCLYARYYNYMKDGRKGYVFRDRYVSEPITSKRYFINCIKYIHMNPIKAGIVRKCEEYKYSSFNYYKQKNLNKELKENGYFSKSDFNDIINNVYTDYVFQDVDENIDYKVRQGISEFIKKEQTNLFKVFSNRESLIKLIKFLKDIKKIKYIQIRVVFDMTRGTMEGIAKKIRKNNK